MDIGKMRDRFAIENPVSHQNSHGENIPGWDRVAEVWGYLRTLSGRQLQLAQASTVTSTATHLITMRYSGDISLTTRLTLTGSDGRQRVFRVNHLDDVDNQHAELMATVTEVKA